MSKISLSSIITPSFLNSFTGVAQKGSSGSSSPLGGGSSSKINLSDGLRTGARAFSNALQGLNSLVGGLHITDDSLKDLLKITDQMIRLAERATKAGSSASASLDQQFHKLSKDFKSKIADTKLGDFLLMDSEALTSIFTNLGMSVEDSAAIADLFNKFVLVEDTDVDGSGAKVSVDGKTQDVDKFLAAETIRGKRPTPIPPSAFKKKSRSGGDLGPIEQVSNEDAQAAGVATGYNVYQADDGSGNQTVHVKSADGSEVNSVSVTTDATLKAVNQQTGYSVLETTEDLIGQNGSNRSQLFLVDTHGTVVHQFTNNGGTDVYGDVDISEDNQTIAFSNQLAGGQQFVTISFDTIGALATAGTRTVRDTLAAGRNVTKVQVSDDGTHAGFVEENGANRTVHLRDLVANTVDTELLSNTGDADFKFLDATQIAIKRDAGSGNFDIVKRTLVPGVAGDPIDPTDPLSKISNNDAQNGGISTGFNVYQAANGGFQTIFIETADGLTTNTLAATANVTLKKVSEHTGYSVIQSTQDFLGQNGSNNAQLFLVNTSGTVVHQFTDNAGSETYGSVDISEDNLTIAVARTDGNDKLVTIEAASHGQSPTLATVTTVETLSTATAQATKVQISDDGNYAAFVAVDGSNSSVHFYDLQNDLYDGVLGAQSGDVDFTFLDNSKLAIVREDGAKFDVLEHYFASGDGVFGATVLGGGAALGSYGDINNDGYLDVAVNQFGSTDVYLGSPDGLLIGPSYSHSGSDQNQTFMDVNDDGNLDLLSTYWTAGTSYLYTMLGNGDGSFQDTITTVITGLDAVWDDRALQSADFDEDGNLDVALTRNAGGSEWVLFGNGDGTFSSVLSIPSGSGFGNLEVGDFDNDGHQDLMRRDTGGNMMHRGNGNGTFQATETITITGTLTTLLAKGDFDADGDLDLVTMEGNDLYVSINDGTGNFAAAVTYASYSTESQVLVADVDSDGKVDLIQSSTSFGRHVILLGNGDGTFGTAVSVLGAGAVQAYADFTGDGILDRLTGVDISVGSGTYTGGTSFNNQILLNDADIGLFAGVQSDTNPQGYFAFQDTVTDALKVYANDGSLEGTYAFDGGDTLSGITLAENVTDGTEIGIYGTVPSYNGDNDDELYRLTVDAAGGGGQNDLGSLSQGSHTDITNGAITNTRNIYQDETGVYITELDGTLIKKLSGSGTILKAVDKESGYSIIESHGDFLGQNVQAYAQLFLVTADGEVVQQFSDNDGTHTYGEVGLSNNLYDLVYARTDGDDTLYHVHTNDWGNTPYSGGVTTTAIDTLATGRTSGKVQFNDEGTYAGWVEDNAGTKTVRVYNLVASTSDSISGSDFGFLSADTIAVVQADGGAFDVVKHRFSDNVSILSGPHKEGNGSLLDVVVADLNQDGILDLVGGSYDYIRVSLGNGDGTFQAETTFGTSGNYTQIKYNPVHLGIVALDTSNNTVNTFTGFANGNFTVQTTYALAIGDPRELHLAPINGDAHPDVIVTDGGGDIDVLLGDGLGGFLSASTDTGFQSDLVHLADYDLEPGGANVIAFTDGSALQVRVSNGDGTFQAAVSYALTDPFQPVRFGDLNNDGHLDAVVGAGVLLSNNDGTFQSEIYSSGVATLSTSYEPVFSDFNDDDEVDILTMNGSGEFKLYYGDGAGNLSGGDIVTGRGGFDHATGDLNSDGNLDFVTESQGGGGWDIYYGGVDNDATIFNDVNVGAFTTSQQGYNQTALIAFEETVNQDVTLYDINGNVLERSHLGPTSDVTNLTISHTVAGGREVGIVGTVSELNGDTDSELYRLGAGGKGTGGFQTRFTSAGNQQFALTPVRQHMVADFNNDGNLDYYKDNYGKILIGKGDGTFYEEDGGTLLFYDSGDVNGDGYLDVIGETPGGYLALTYGSSSGAQIGYQQFTQNIDDARFGDIDNDGNLDIVSFDLDVQEIYVNYGNGDGTFSSRNTSSTPSAAPGYEAFQLLDTDSDGLLDFVIRGFSYKGYGTSGFLGETSVSVNLADPDNFSSFVADMNKDGIDDLVYDNGVGGEVEVALNNGDGTFATPVSFSGSISFAGVADIDGNGNLDLISNLIYRGNGDGTFNISATGLPGGAIFNVAATGDFNNDGIVDVLANSGGVGYTFLGNKTANTRYDGSEFVEGGNDLGAISKVANTDAQNGGISTGFNTYQAASGGFQAIFFKSSDGTITNSLTASSNITLKAVDEKSGYAVVQSTEDFIGQNASNYSQLFLVNNQGEVVHQYTDNDGTKTFGDADVSGDLLSIVTHETVGATRTVATYTSLQFGSGPTRTALSGLFGDETASNLRINDDGTQAGFLRSTVTNNREDIRLYDLAASTRDTSLDINGHDRGFEFLGTGRIAVSRTTDGAHSNIVEHWVGDTSGDRVILAGVEAGKMKAIESGLQGNAYIAVENRGQNSIDIYDDQGNLVDRSQLGINDTVEVLSVARNNAGGVETGIFGTIQSLDEDTDTELYRVDAVRNGDGTFQAGITTGSTATGEIYDINNDGILDFYHSGGAYFGNGDGTFSLGVTSGLSSPFSFGDVNNDGFIDRVEVNASEIVTRFGQENGQFGDPVITSESSSGNPQTSVLMDTDADGILDVVASTDFDGYVDTYLGNGDGTFQAPETSQFYLGLFPIDNFITLDYNDDGAQDLLMENENSGRTIFENQHNGQFSGQIRSIATAGRTHVYAEDFNQDGHDDVITEGGAGGMQIHLSNGDSTFATGVTISGGASAAFGGAADFNGDGILDILQTGSSPKLFLGNGDGTFDAGTAILGGATHIISDIADINNDGIADILAAPTGTPTALKVFFGNSTASGRVTGTVPEEDPIDPGPSDPTYDEEVLLNDVAVGKFAAVEKGLSRSAFISIENTSNDKVLVYDEEATLVDSYQLATTDSVTGLSITRNFAGGAEVGILGVVAGVNSDADTELYRVSGKYHGDGTFGTTVTYDGASPAARGKPVLGDLDRDGILDIVSTDPTNAQLRVQFGNGDGTFGAATSYNTTGVSPKSAAIADFDGDGDLDVGVLNADGDEQVEIFTNDGTGVLETGETLALFGSVNGNEGLLAGDLNNDGYVDLIAGGGNNGSSPLNYFKGNGDGTFQAVQTIAGTGNSFLHASQLADFNEDGNLDILAGGQMILNNGDNTFQASYDAGAGTSLIAADTNLDGDLDLIGAPAGGNLQVVYGAGDGSFGSGITVTTGAVMTHIEMHDINGDGIQDIISSTDTGDLIAINLGNGDGTFQAVQTSALGAAATNKGFAVGDLNADGVSDVVTDVGTAIGRKQAGTEASDRVQGTRIKRRLRNTREYDSLFAIDRRLSNPPDAYRILHDLKALKEQLTENRKVMKDAFQLVENNIELVRTAGLAFLNVGNQIKGTEEAGDVARKLQREIAKAPAGALAQAENLNAIAVAGLLADDPTLSKKK